MCRPAVPSLSAPVRMTPITRAPYAAAAERNSGSMAGLDLFSFGPRVVFSRLESSISKWWSGGATYMCPLSTDAPSAAAVHGSGPATGSRDYRVVCAAPQVRLQAILGAGPLPIVSGLRHRLMRRRLRRCLCGARHTALEAADG